MIYLDNAATSGYKPKIVVDAMNNALKKYNANPGRSGYKTAMDTAIAVYKVREKINKLFNANGAECVCFTANCTHSINYVLNGVLNSGDHIVVSSLEHNAVMRPIHYLRDKKGIEFDVAEVDIKEPKNTINNFRKLIKDNTKMIFTTNASNVTGTIIPLEQIGRICKENNLLFGVDAAQTAGVLDINMQKFNIDFLCIAAHKGLYAPMGAGILIANKPIENLTVLGGTGTNSNQMQQPSFYPDRIESGTVNVPTIFGIGAGVDFVDRIGINNIYKKELQLVQYLYEKLARMKCDLYTPYPEYNTYVPLISFNIKEKNSIEVSEYLGKKGIAVRGGFHCAPFAHKAIKTEEIGTVRVSPGISNNKNDCDKLIFTLKNLK